MPENTFHIQPKPMRIALADIDFVETDQVNDDELSLFAVYFKDGRETLYFRTTMIIQFFKDYIRIG